MRKTIATLATIWATIFVSVLVLTTGSATVVSADPADVFPSGPYTATLVADPVVSTRTLINMVASVAIVFLILASEVIVSVY